MSLRRHLRDLRKSCERKKADSMSKSARIILVVILILIPLLFYRYFHKDNVHIPVVPLIQKPLYVQKPKVAIIFDDLGETIKDFDEINALNTPVTISIIPGLKFSNQVAQLGQRAGFSIFIHVPLEPKNSQRFKTDKYKFISSRLSGGEINRLLSNYLNAIRLAIGVNGHMGSQATTEASLMKVVITAVKQRGLIFVDSKTIPSSLAYKIAKKEGLICGYNEGFFDSLEDPLAMRKRFEELASHAKEKGKVIIIGHPKRKTIELLQEILPRLKKEYEFVTIKDYFGL
jgi:uncharacterized protein